MDVCINNYIPIEVYWPNNFVLVSQRQSATGGEVEFSNFEEIDSLFHKKLKQNIFIKIEEDDGSFIASLLNMPIYGYGKTAKKTIASIKRQIELCYKELSEDDNISQEWIEFKKYLNNIIE